MICLAYLSSASEPMTASALSEIVAQSHRNNLSDDVTGMLCHYDGSFLQFLEGPAKGVERVFKRVSRDRRHSGLIEVFRRPIEARLFADWSMAMVKPEDLGPEQRAWSKGLRELELNGRAEHRAMVEPLLGTFRAWMR